MERGKGSENKLKGKTNWKREKVCEVMQRREKTKA